MATSDLLNKLRTDITDTYTSINNLGGTIPEHKNTENISPAIESIYNKLPKVSDIGTDLSLNPTLEARLGLIPRGNTSQDGTPTPTSPIMPKVVTGENSVKVENRNLFDKDNTTLGRIDTSGAVATITGYYTSDFIKVEPNTSYTKNSPTADAYHRFAFYTSDDTSGFISVSNSNTKTTPSNCKYLRFCGIDGEQDTTLLVKGTTATDYVEHKEQNYPLSLGNMELVEIPDTDYADYIEGTPDNWVKKENINKVILNGSEGWSLRSDGTFQIRINGVINRTKVYSNYFNYSRTSETTGTVYTVDNYLRFYFNEITAIEDLKTWLSTHNTIIWYPLAEPTDVPITDTTLINQLNALYYARSYDDETNISTSCEDGNMPMKINASALKGASND
jgi:hypothetical protein